MSDTPQYNTDETYLTPGEVAALFRVDAKTVARWAKSGKLASFRTLGGHRRYTLTGIRAAVERAEEEALAREVHDDDEES